MTTNPEQLLIEVVMNHIGKPITHTEQQVRRCLSEALAFLIEQANPEDVRIVHNAVELLRDFDVRLYQSLMGSYLTNDIITAVQNKQAVSKQEAA